MSFLNEVKRHNVDAFGYQIHVAEMGEGPLVLFVHGFPESWYSWRNQLPALAAAGYRAAAIDVRGYGSSAAPEGFDAYRLIDLAADCVGVVEALGETTATIVGHDWGSPIAAAAARLRPDVFTAMALLSVPYDARNDHRPSETFASFSDTEEFYITYFQKPGQAEAEIAKDPRRWLAGFYFSASGDCPPPEPGQKSMGFVPPGGLLSDGFSYPSSPLEWMTDADLDFYTAEFAKAGFTGGLNRYRCIDYDWVDLRAWHHAVIRQPSLFIGGEKDGPTQWGAGAISRYPETLPGLRGTHILEGAGHWLQQEAAETVNDLLLEFLDGL
jgi:pimeloyl-ACP methyl ester carboxylesterase